MANAKEHIPPVIFAAQQEIPISRLDIRGHLITCNDAYLALSGYTREDLLDQPHERINHPLMPKQVIERMWETLRGGVPWTAPMMGRDKQGTTFGCNLYVVPLFEGGQLAPPWSADRSTWPSVFFRVERINLQASDLTALPEVRSGVSAGFLRQAARQ